MNPIDREGWWRGFIIDHTVNTIGDHALPQLAGEFQATAFYNDEMETGDPIWEDWNEFDMGMAGYFILFGKAGAATFNLADVRKAVGWDGKSLTALNDMDLSKVPVMFRTKYEEYQGNNKLKVVSIRHIDEEPGGSFKVLNDAELASLDAKFGAALQAAAGSQATVPKTVATATAAVDPPPSPAPQRLPDAKKLPPPKAKPKVTKKGKAKTAASPVNPPAAGEPSIPSATPPAAPVPSATVAGTVSPSEAPVTPKKIEPMTMNDAYGKVWSLRDNNITEDRISEVWLTALDRICKGKDNSIITDLEWGTVAEECLKPEFKIAKF